MGGVPASRPLLEVVDLWKAFGGLVAVRGVTFQVAPGEILGLLGPNGSGKTTVFNLIAGALQPWRGRVLLDGQEITGLRASARTRLGIGRTFQLVRAFGHLSALENVLVARLYGADRPATLPAAAQEARELLALVGLRDRADQPAGLLNLGQRKRLELARALAGRPRLLLLDEPLAGLNPTEVQEALTLLRRLRREGMTILIVEHNLLAVRSLCDRAVVLNSGEVIAAGHPQAVLEDPQVVEVYLGRRDQLRQRGPA
ncbi:MAG: ABC transporter ATP-binding protein [Armatimonadota bacterium]|nr:ABC transporter ATP-binding protein [Armatimonadota bacterium]MDR7449602.1 ABC transporter ATP-binding protein [Armatimonadota bacterium]MDR7460359.1 ABC transporter ATP-binding protein [Armatimonadota bacterium]MDR7488092.1 ABC transporter ATP-binding protein [Armatimonadota bacterium]MDR7492127.1 ABC transporter ATP-binding protein [Armatimonadota bacterium]